MTGKKLLNEVAQATGLPDHLISNELSTLIESAGISAEEMTLDDLRQVLAEYLQDVLVQAKERQKNA